MEILIWFLRRGLSDKRWAFALVAFTFLIVLSNNFFVSLIGAVVVFAQAGKLAKAFGQRGGEPSLPTRIDRHFEHVRTERVEIEPPAATPDRPRPVNFNKSPPPKRKPVDLPRHR